MKFKIGRPVVVADAGLLSNKNIKILEEKGYEYIIGARVKNKSERIKAQILSHLFCDGAAISKKRKTQQGLPSIIQTAGLKRMDITANVA